MEAILTRERAIPTTPAPRTKAGWKRSPEKKPPVERERADLANLELQLAQLQKRLARIERAFREKPLPPAIATKPLLAPEKPIDRGVVSPAEAAELLHLASPNTVRQRIADGKLYAIRAPGRERGQVLPAWQFNPLLLGEPMQQLLNALRAVGKVGWDAHYFFEEPRAMLGGLSPRQALEGTADSEGYAARARTLLAANPKERLARVLATIEESANDD